MIEFKTDEEIANMSIEEFTKYAYTCSIAEFRRLGNLFPHHRGILLDRPMTNDEFIEFKGYEPLQYFTEVQQPNEPEIEVEVQ